MTAELDLERGYFIAATNARHALAGTLSVPPLRFLVSVSHDHDVGSTRDLYALATVRT